jgi:N utilization substance protein A
MDTDALGRIAAQSAKQVIIQRLKDAERESVYDEFKDRRGEIINGIVQRVDRSGIVVNLGRAEAALPPREQIPREVYRQGDRIRAYILDVKRISKGPQVILSRTHPYFVIQLFRNEVPEIAEGIVSIIAAAREPGSRAKIAVVSRDSDVDPVGACVGMKGSRVQSVVQELRGEKIDIVPWNMDPAKFVVNALAPAIISKVIIDQANRNMEVIVPDDQLSLAIGKRGQNVRLASKLTNWHIDVKGETRYQRQKESGYQALLRVSALSEALADKLYEAGIGSLEDLAGTHPVDLRDLTGFSDTAVESMVEEAERLLAEGVSAEAAEAAELAESGTVPVETDMDPFSGPVVEAVVREEPAGGEAEEPLPVSGAVPEEEWPALERAVPEPEEEEAGEEMEIPEEAESAGETAEEPEPERLEESEEPEGSGQVEQAEEPEMEQASGNSGEESDSDREKESSEQAEAESVSRD